MGVLTAIPQITAILALRVFSPNKFTIRTLVNKLTPIEIA